MLAFRPWCDDGIACTTDSCDVTSGCIHTPQDTTCADAIDCTVDTCNVTTGCVHTPDAARCADNVACTVDTCDPAIGCVHTPDDAACDDGVACTVDTCDSTAGCTTTVDDSACLDTSPCARSLCDPLSGCTATPQLLGDVTHFGMVDITDVACEVLSLVALQTAAPLPACLQGSLVDLDVDCDGKATVTDALVVAQQALGLALAPQLDANADGCPDACP